MSDGVVSFGSHGRSAGSDTQLVQVLQRFIGSGPLLDALPAAIYCCDRDGVIRQYNKRASELWGRAPRIGEPDERFCGSHKLFLPDGTPLPRKETPMAEALRSGKPTHDRNVVVERPDGSRLTLRVNIEPLIDDDGAVVGAVNCFQDVTELTQAHEELRRSKHELEDFFENAAVALHIVGSDGRIIRANKAELALLGYSAEEYVGHDISEFHADTAALAEILARLRAGEQLLDFPATLAAKDGSIRHVLITSNGAFRDGDFIHTRCFTSNVTERKYAEERARHSEDSFRRLLESLPAAIYTTDAEGNITFYNEAAVQLSGRRPEIGTDKWCVSLRLFSADGSPMRHDECPMAVAVRERRPVRDVEAICERPDGSRVRFIPYPTPMFDAAGRLVGAVNMMVDITERVEAEIQAAHMAAIVASSDDAIVSKSLDGQILSWNPGATRIFGYEPEEIVGQHITRIIPPELHGQEDEILARLRRGEHIGHFETVRLAKDGRRLDISLSVSPIRDRSGRVVAAAKVARDITERKKHEELQGLLFEELNHRVKNTLGIIQSLAIQSLRRAEPAELVNSFHGRVQALARAHDLVVLGKMKGAELSDILREQVLLDPADGTRITYQGPRVDLDPRLAVQLGLVLHELATNARKYGALSVPDGRLAIRWNLRVAGGRELHLTWTETGVPDLSAPARSGFGTSLIQRTIESNDGAAILEYRPDGLDCDITLPLPETADEAPVLTGVPAGRTGPGSHGQQAVGDVGGARILVIEDEPIIALGLTSQLEAAGLVVVGPAGTVDAARRAIDTQVFDAALLDANLAGHSVGALAASLARRGVPFAFATGHGSRGLPDGFEDAPLLAKPFRAEEVLRTVTALLAGKRPDNVIPFEAARGE